jgi:glycosyltransferase involved in cell wall biosynthesis
LRVLHISSAQAFGGGERCLVDLVKGLSARGHDLFVALRPGSPLISELASLPRRNLLELPLRNALDARSASQLASFVGRQRIEIAHAHMARDYPIAAYATRRNRAAQLIVTRHVLFPMNRLHKITLSRVARVIAVSEAVARRLRAEKLAPLEKISVVHNGIDLARFETAISYSDRERFCHDLRLPEQSVLVGSVGALNPLKGHEDFLAAAARIASLFPTAYFIIAGADVSPAQTNRANLERSIKKLELDKRVRLIGKMADITPLFCALDVFVSASYTESFGLAIAEAMAGETPVVATETEGAKEIIQEGETGLLVPLGDIGALAESLSTLLKDKERRQRMGRKARDEVRKRFSLERMVDETERIYRESL